MGEDIEKTYQKKSQLEVRTGDFQRVASLARTVGALNAVDLSTPANSPMSFRMCFL